ncbi:OTU domain-containing protein 5-B isoform X3 [Atheta coriaria]|uniref:OTU domain-containing protein 5-B isoform X3 n=1 Tax=Dalotia coriaria TaxID=877792 RepID=UPI0031F3EE39
MLFLVVQSATPEPTDHCMRKRFKEAKSSRRKLARERERLVNRVEQPVEEAQASTSEVVDITKSDEVSCAPANENTENEEEATGFNSEDEYGAPIHNPTIISDEEWKTRDTRFARCLQKLGFEIKSMRDDGACLFRAIADQIYGDQELHFTVRSACMDYIVKNKDFFANYVTEDFDKYIARKRLWNVHGNHLEIQAMSEMYNRTIEVYCYEVQPINIFNSPRLNADEPIRLSYHRMCHYNSICNPNNPSVGVGLGLPAYHTIDLNRRRMVDAVRASEDIMIEQTMLEDKLKATDWEATYEAIEEEVARESYIQYYRDAEKRLKPQGHAASSSSTITSAVCSSPRQSARRGSVSPKTCASPGSASPKSSGFRPAPKSPAASNCIAESATSHSHIDTDKIFKPSSPKNSLYEEFEAIYNTEYPETSSTFTKDATTRSEANWDDGIMAQVLAESRKTYLDDLKRKSKKQGSPGPSTSR